MCGLAWVTKLVTSQFNSFIIQHTTQHECGGSFGGGDTNTIIPFQNKGRWPTETSNYFARPERTDGPIRPDEVAGYRPDDASPLPSFFIHVYQNWFRS